MHSKFYSSLYYFKLMLFSGKTMALPQQSISCQIFVRQQHQYAALLLVLVLFPHLYRRNFLMLKQVWRIKYWNQRVFWQCQDLNEGIHGSMPRGRSVSWIHRKKAMPTESLRLQNPNCRLPSKADIPSVLLGARLFGYKI